MIRAVKFPLKHLTARKRRCLEALLREYRTAVQFYVNVLWAGGRIQTSTQKQYAGGQLRYDHKTSALRSAFFCVSTTRKAAKATGRKPSRPRMRGALRLTKHICRCELGKGSFDYILRITSLRKGRRLIIPFNGHRRLNHWLAKPGARILNGGIIGKDCFWLYVDVPTQPTRTKGKSLGVDVGYNKLLATSDGKFYGRGIKDVCGKVWRRKPGSKGKRCARMERDQYINRIVKQLPWNRLAVLGIEDLRGIKNGKGMRSRKFRRAMAPWTHRQVGTRLTLLAQENRVRLVLVDPRNTSRTCPSCGSVAKENRAGENFRCVRCNYSADADYVGAVNVLARTAGNSQEIAIPGLPKKKGKPIASREGNTEQKSIEAK